MNLYHLFRVFHFVTSFEDCMFVVLFVVDFKFAVFRAEKMLKIKEDEGGE